MTARVGVDVGGTFTDLVVTEDGSLSVRKRPSTPEDPAVGVLSALEPIPGTEIDPADVDVIGHGTTVATNAVLEEEWAETALLTTAGCRDVLEIGRQERPALYDLSTTRPEPIVPRDRRFEVDERVDERGNVLTPLHEADVTEAVDAIRAAEVEAVALSLLFAFENESHERRLQTALEAADLDAAICRSSAVLPEIREYERTVATALNAALQPVVSTYVDRLQSGLDHAGVAAPLRMMQSNGGTAAADRIAERPIGALLSGPAAGVQGAIHVADTVDQSDVITMDMGGTSCDVSLVRDGEPTVSTEVAVGPYELALPMIEIETIGAGGGSIAWLDDGGALRIGPDSAGADPGPICYDRGGQEPTVTDAHVLVGRLTPTLLPEAGAEIETVRSRFRDALAGPMEREVAEAAQGVIDVANANMAGAIRVVSVERGHDPRSVALVAFGGAGPLHAAEIAASLEIPRVIVPPLAGVLSALGLLVADRVYADSRSQVRALDTVEPGEIADQLARFETTGREQLAAEGVPPDRMQFEPAADLRYVGQSYTVRVPIPVPEGAVDVEKLASRFHERYEQRYGHAAPAEPVELVTIRMRSRGTVEPPTLDRTPVAGDVADAVVEEREMYANGRWYDGTVYDRDRLPAESTVRGPAVIGAEDTTIFVPPARAAEVAPNGTVLIEVTD